jgi:hypothetical protein
MAPILLPYLKTIWGGGLAMPTKVSKVAPTNGSDLVKEILEDVQTLVSQHLQLFRQEVYEEIDQAKSRLVTVGVGAGMMGLAGVMSSHMAVHLVHRVTKLPLWASYGVVAGLLGGIGYQLAAGRRLAGNGNQGLLPQTTAVIQEDLAWIQGQNPTR